MGIASSMSLSSGSDSVPWHMMHDEDSQQTYVALHDFEPEYSWGEQLSMKKGSKLRLVSQNTTREWCEVESTDDESSATGWVPRNFIAPKCSLEANDWYHGEIDLATAEFLLGKDDGTYLVRKSTTQVGSYALSVLINGKPTHYRISNDLGGNFYIHTQEKLPSLSSLVEYYQQKRSGVSVWLRKPAVKSIPPLYTFSPDHDEWEIDREDLSDEEYVGKGSFGIVQKAVWKKFDVVVAIKRLKEDYFSKDLEEEFRKEAETMKAVKHPNLIQLLGVSTMESPYLLISEFMHEGDLSKYLQKFDKTSITWNVLLHMAVQVNMGMEYLEERKFVHRDLAGRNCFVGKDNIVKVGDFGLSRLACVNDMYQGGRNCLFPVKWTAPEGILKQIFTSKSDVWSFGVLLWEIATLGKEVPYSNIPGPLLFFELENGYRLEQPSTCPDQLYELMQICWKFDYDERPSFSEIRSKINALCELVRQVYDVMNIIQQLEDGNN